MIMVDNVLVGIEAPTDEQWERGIIAILSIEVPGGGMVEMDCIERDGQLGLAYTGGPHDSWIKDTLHDTILDYLSDMVEEVEVEV